MNVSASTPPLDEEGVILTHPPPLGYLIFQALFLSVVMVVTVLGNIAVSSSLSDVSLCNFS